MRLARAVLAFASSPAGFALAVVGALQWGAVAVAAGSFALACL